MNKTALALVLAFCFAPAIFAQNHGEFGVFGEYLRLHDFGTNQAGAGGRLAVNVHSHVQLEAEMAYDFRRGFRENFVNGVPAQFATANSSLRVLHGEFGPKFQTGGGAWRLFGTVKGGFISFGFKSGDQPLPGFTSAINNLRRDNTSGVLYPGGGAEIFLGPIGIRAEVGDEIYFVHGTHHALKVSLGPQFRF